MKPHEAQMILDPDDPYEAKDEALRNQALKMGASALSKFSPETVIGGKCPSCHSKAYRDFPFCPRCAQMLRWKK